MQHVFLLLLMCLELLLLWNELLLSHRPVRLTADYTHEERQMQIELAGLLLLVWLLMMILDLSLRNYAVALQQQLRLLERLPLHL